MTDDKQTRADQYAERVTPIEIYGSYELVRTAYLDGFEDGCEFSYDSACEEKRAENEGERARAAKLIEALKETIEWWSVGDGLSAFEAAKQALAEYEASK